MQCKGSYKGDPKGLQRGGRRRGQKISGNFIFQEFWDDMPRPGWSPWWVQRRPQTIPGPTFEPLTERPTRAPLPPKGSPKDFRISGNLQVIYGRVTGNLRAICDELRATLRAIYGPFATNYGRFTGHLGAICDGLRAICDELRASYGQFAANYGRLTGNSLAIQTAIQTAVQTAVQTAIVCKRNGCQEQEEWLPGHTNPQCWAHKSPVLGTQIPSVGHTVYIYTV